MADCFDDVEVFVLNGELSLGFYFDVIESFEVLEEVFHDLRRRVHAHVETHELEDEHPVRPQIRVHESLGKGEEEVIELR